RRVSLLWRERPAAVQRQEPLDALARAAAFLFERGLAAGRAAHRLAAHGGRARRAADGSAARETARTASQPAAAPPGAALRLRVRRQAAAPRGRGRDRPRHVALRIWRVPHAARCVADAACARRRAWALPANAGLRREAPRRLLPPP